MAVSAIPPRLTLNLFGIFPLFIAVITSDNSTIYNLNTTVLGDENDTSLDLFSTSTPQPTGVDLTTPTPSGSGTEEPVLPTASTEPLPVSGRLPTPVTDSKPFYYRTRLLN